MSSDSVEELRQKLKIESLGEKLSNSDEALAQAIAEVALLRSKLDASEVEKLQLKTQVANMEIELEQTLASLTQGVPPDSAALQGATDRIRIQEVERGNEEMF